MVVVCFTMSTLIAKPSFSQDPITEIIRQAVIKVIKAVDLKIQRLQNKTIWLQNAQKAVENKMQELKLGEISDWVERQRKLYADYYEELWKVKSAIAYYGKVRDIIKQQVDIVTEYKKSIGLFAADRQFTTEELAHIKKVLTGILEESAKNLDGLYFVLSSFSTQMTDAERLQLIDAAGKGVEANLTDLRKFRQQTIQLRLQRARDEKELQIIKKLYGIQ